MKKVKIIFFGIALLAGSALRAQDSTASLSITGFVEAYYLYDFNRPADNNRPPFIYSHNRHNEFNINMAFIKATYTAKRERANIAMGEGTYMNANYAAEPGVLKNIYEADAGIRIGKKDLWLDAGIMPSHIGFESAVSKDCWNLTRSILADNSPYFEAGAKLSYTTVNGKWLFSAMALNGWQRITRVSGNSLMSWGTQVQFKPSSTVLFNSSTFIGTDKPDSARLNRFFHNFYGIFNLSHRVGVTAGFDIGTEEKAIASKTSNSWYSTVLIVKYILNDKWAVAGRCEYYSDAHGVIISTGTVNGFKTNGFSLNIDHSPYKNVLVRLEIRHFGSKDAIFTKGTSMVKSNTFITSSIAVSL
jgi:hypothetical protein